METLIDSGRVVDLVLGVLILELSMAGLFREALRRRSGGRLLATQLLVGALPGAALLMALRTALTDGTWQGVAVWLGLSFILHLADLIVRARPPSS